METRQAYRVAQDFRIPQDGNTYYFGVQDSQGYTPLQPWIYAHVMLNMTVTAGANVAFSVEISNDGVNWYGTTIHNLTAAQNKWTQAANVALAANTVAAIMGVSNPAHFLRVLAVNTGAAPADINRLEFVTES